MLTGPEKRTTADQVLSFIVQSCASPRACLTAFLTALLERGIAAGSMRSAVHVLVLVLVLALDFSLALTLASARAFTLALPLPLY